MSRLKPIETIRQKGKFFCVKSRRKYYCVEHDPETGMTRGIIPSDRVAGVHREMEGWSREAIEFVAKPHKKDTAIAYFNAFWRAYRKSLVTEGPSPQEDGGESSDDDNPNPPKAGVRKRLQTIT